MNPPSPSTRQVVLGLFVVWQLWFLLTSNLIGFLKDNRTESCPEARQVIEAVAPGWLEEKGHMWHITEHVARADKMWAQATGQFQMWALFAPNISRAVAFPALEIRWDDEPGSAAALAGSLALLAARNPLEASSLAEFPHLRMPPAPELVLSDNEPANLQHYARMGTFRIRRYENNMVINLRPDDKETLEQANERWREKIRSHVADYAAILHGYLRWRTAQALTRWPGRQQPRQVILVLRQYAINDPATAPPYWTGPHVLPLARWQPRAAWDADHQSLEWFDPVAQGFKVLRK